MTRDEVPAAVTRVLGRRARWVPRELRVFYYDGVERTLQVFDVPVRDQMRALESLDGIREEIETAAGGPVIILFCRS